MSHPARLQEIIEEIKRRQFKHAFLDPSFPKQYACAQDKSFLKAVQGTRRAGKSTGEARETLETAFNEPESKHLYGALTLPSAKNIIWDVLLESLDANKVSHSVNSHSGIITLKAQKSSIRLFGIDTSYKEMRKILGGKYKTVKIDEAGSITQDLKKICYQMVMPALTDVNGRLTLLGTAENIPKTFFERVTSGKEEGWSIHKWTAFDNPYIAEKWAEHIAWIQKNNPSFMLTSEYRTHYLNEWCADDSKIIIKTNSGTVVPRVDLVNPTFILGVDLGYDDASAFTLVAFHSRSPNLYVVKSFKSKEMDITDVANTIKRLMKDYPILRIIVDGANKQGVEEMKKRHNLPLFAAEKQDKATFLKLLADDVTQNRVQYFEGECDTLIEEQESLQWKDEYRNEEDPRCDNHENDSFLYAWRESRNYLFTPEKDKAPSIYSDKYMDEYAKQLIARRKAQNEY